MALIRLVLKRGAGLIAGQEILRPHEGVAAELRRTKIFIRRKTTNTRQRQRDCAVIVADRIHSVVKRRLHNAFRTKTI